MEGQNKNMEGGREAKGGLPNREDSRSGRYEISRLEYIRLRLKRGDKKRIAEKLNVHPEWVSQVIRGKGVSESVLSEAERMIRTETDSPGKVPQ
jgi:hypothetical protein